jgi:hypothetical protein
MAIPQASVPKAVKDRIKENEAKLTGTPSPAPAAEPAAPAPAPVAAPPKTQDAPVPPVAQPQTPEPMFKPISEPAPAAEPVDKPKTATPEELLKRTSDALSILQRRYNGLADELAAAKQANAGLEAVKAENAQLTTKVADLERQIAEIKATAAAPAVSVTDAIVTDFDRQTADTWGVRPEDIAGFRQHIVNSVREMPKAQPPTPPTPAPAPAQTASQAKPAELADTDAEYFEQLDSLAGGAAVRMAIVADPQFNVFLSLVDGSSKRVIRDIAVEADTRGDAVTMAEIYRSFTEWKALAVSKTERQPGHLMPDSKGGQGDLNTNKKPVYSQAQVNEFQARVRRHEFSGIGKTPEEARKLADEQAYWSNEFAEARKGGRIRG